MSDHEADPGRRDDRRMRGLVVVALVLLALGALVAYRLGTQASRDQQGKAAAQSQARDGVDLAEDVKDACADGRLAPTDRLCEKAETVASA